MRVGLCGFVACLEGGVEVSRFGVFIMFEFRDFSVGPMGLTRSIKPKGPIGLMGPIGPIGNSSKVLNWSFFRIGTNKPRFEVIRVDWELKSVELARSRANSGELFNRENTANDRKKFMNYGEWSKSLEFARTFRRNYEAKNYCGTEGKIFEQQETKVTK